MQDTNPATQMHLPHLIQLPIIMLPHLPWQNIIAEKGSAIGWLRTPQSNRAAGRPAPNHKSDLCTPGEGENYSCRTNNSKWHFLLETLDLRERGSRGRRCSEAPRSGASRPRPATAPYVLIVCGGFFKCIKRQRREGPI